MTTEMAAAAARLLAPNAVMVKELRSRFRGARAFVVLTGFLGILAATAYLVFDNAVSPYQGYQGAYGPPRVGETMFLAVVVLETVLIAIMAPALGAIAVSGERERQTYDLLLATPLSSWSIVAGKLAAAMAFLLILLFSALIVMSLAFLYGGVTPAQLVLAQASALVGGYFLFAIGIAASASFHRTARAMMVTALAVLWLNVQPIVSPYAWYALTDGDAGDALSAALAQLSPIWIAFHLVRGQAAGASAEVAVLQSMLAQIILGTAFVLIAAARVRPLGRSFWIVPLLLVGFALWWAWLVAVPFRIW